MFGDRCSGFAGLVDHKTSRKPQPTVFKIFVVGDDFFRADNTTWLDGNPLFTADVTYLRPPTWITSSYLGLYRANNYITLILDTYETENVLYSLEQVNADCRAKTRKRLEADNKIASIYLTTTLTTAVPQVGYKLTFAGLVPGSSIIHTIANVASLVRLGEYLIKVAVS